MRKDSTLSLVLIGSILVAFVATALGAAMMTGAWNGSMMGPGMMWSYGAPGSAPNAGGWHWSMRLAGLLAALAFWGALISGAILLVRWVLGPSAAAGSSSDGEQPLAVLRRHYAAGETDRPTFERMKHGLES